MDRASAAGVFVRESSVRQRIMYLISTTQAY